MPNVILPPWSPVDWSAIFREAEEHAMHLRMVREFDARQKAWEREQDIMALRHRMFGK